VKKIYWAASAATVAASAAAIVFVAMMVSSQPAVAHDCPNGGTVRFGVEPYDTAARLTPIYEKVGKLIGIRAWFAAEAY